MPNYPINNYNKYVCLKANDLMIIISLILLKPYIIAIASVANMRDRNALINLFYADKLIISIEAIATIPFLILIYAWLRRTPNASDLARSIWKNGKKLIIATAVIQLGVASIPLWLSVNYSMNNIYWAQIFLYFFIIITTFNSSYMKDCFADFPDKENNS